jgi:hypothetical protein
MAEREPTQEDRDNARAHELALRDIQNIKALRESEPFRNYWMRKLKDRHERALDRLVHDPAFKMVTRMVDGKETTIEVPFCTKEQREETRQVVLALEDLMGMMDRDYNSAGSQLIGERNTGFNRDPGLG